MRFLSVKRKSVLCLLLCFALLIPAFCPVTAKAVTQEQINTLKEELKLLDKQAEEQQEVINRLTENKSRVIDRKIALDGKIDLTLRQIDLIGEQVEIYNQIISEKETELQEAMDVETAQSEMLRRRVRAMEEGGNYSFVNYLFESSSYSDLLGRIADVNDIMHYDQILEEQYISAREDVQELKHSYEEYRLQQEDLVKELDTKKFELDSMIEAASQLISSIDEMSEDAQAEYDAIAEVRAQTDAELNELLEKLAAEEAAKKAAEEAARRAQQGTGGGSGGGGSGGVVSLSNFRWPVPSCTIITSRFGYRVSPTAGASSYHGGLDIGAGRGAAIVAAEEGDVILASYNGGYGNCVMINHGGGIVTLYGHMESIAASYGQHVTKGQIVGYVGSTGVSTGPHCHFEIRVNGAQTDPAPYFSGLTYYC